jgi:ATP-dependent DNA helicase RecG
MNILNLNSKIQYLNGIGPKYLRAFTKLGIRNIEDMITFFPIQYQDRSNICLIKDIHEQSQICIFGKIGKNYEKVFSKGFCLLDIEIFDSTSMIYARFFRKKNPYMLIDNITILKKSFKTGIFAYIYGNIKIEYGIKFIIVNDYELVKNYYDKPLSFNKIIPVYPTIAELNQKFIRKTIKNVLDTACMLYPDISDIIPSFNNSPKLKSSSAIKKIHYPSTLKEAEHARRTFALQEFFIFETALLLSKNNIKKNIKIQKYTIHKTLLTTFKNNLQFEFTNDQKKAINEIFSDMQSLYPMNRLLIGDVGSGKTAVAVSAILLAVENHYQTMIIAPTEILAEQHYLTILNMLKGLDVKITLATSSRLNKKNEREKILTSFKNGNTKIAIGTHSLIEKRIKFKNLSLAVIDEQHRFGVMQKFATFEKAKTPDILMMTATPIPRSLAMTIYSELDITTITQLPPGRVPTKTYLSSEQVAYKNTIEELKKGNQAYIVCPFIDKSDRITIKSAIQESKRLSQTWFKDFKVGLLHGRMKTLQKNDIIKRFKNKKIDILVSTTLIEVGIDIPDVTIMIIQHAERFGLSALHQLRGRIGRNSKQSYLYLIGNSKNINAHKRLSIMISTNSGFKIAEEDLKLRGPGELIGTIQHGFPKFKAGNLIKDADIIKFTKNFAEKLIANDPNLSKNKNYTLKKLISKHFSDKIKLINVG